MAYTPEQQRIIRAIIRIGRRRRERPKEIMAALMAGRVESNFRNLRYGDRDSRGWRQERASLYRNPNNVRASINRFYNETSGEGRNGRGMTAGQLAQAVQGSAFPGRYQPHKGEARRLMRSVGRGKGWRRGGAGSRIVGGRRGVPGTVGVDPRQSPEPGSTWVADLLRDQLESQSAPRMSSSGLTPPAHSAQSALKIAGAVGGQQIASSGPPRAEGPDIGELLQQIAKATAASPGVRHRGTPGVPGIPGRRGRRVRRGGEVARGRYPRSLLAEMFYRGPGGINVDEGRRVGRDFVSGHEGHTHVASRNRRHVLRLLRLARRMGLTVREHPAFDPVDPVHTGGSFHYSRRAGDVSGPPRRLRRYNRRVARMHGI